MKKACLGLMILCLALGFFFSSAGADETRLTLMIYLTGSDLESNASAASDELAEIMAAYPEGSGIDVIVMASGSKAWTSEAISGDETAIYELHADGLEKVQTGPLRSMGSPDTLLSLLDYGYTHYPAEQYALILWDHGAGPMMGVCFDELFTDGQDMDSLTMPELASALAASPFAEQKLQWIGFDACLMACIEVASTVAPYAEYMIASQDTEPASGWDYAFLRDIANDATTEETGRRIIDLYMDSVGETLSTITLSLIDLSVIPAVEEEMNAFFGSLSETVSVDSYARLTACRTDTKSLACASPGRFDLVDLLDLLDVYQSVGVADCEALMSLLGQAIVYNRANMAYINGLSLYYPYDNKDDYLASWGRRAAEAEFSPGYRAFLRDISSIWLGEALADWNTGLYMELASVGQGTAISMQLTREQATHFGGAQLYVLEQLYPNEYRFIYMTDDVVLTPENRLEIIYTGQALCMVDENGDVLTDALTYTMRDDMIFLPSTLFSELSLDSTDEWKIINADLFYREDERGEYALVEAVEMGDDPLLSGRSAIRLEDLYEISFAGVGFVPTYDEAGRLAPFSSWSNSDSMSIEQLLIGDPLWHPVFTERYGAMQRIALLQVYDDQNNVAFVEMLPLDNPNIISIPVASQVLTDNELCRITLTGAELVTGEDNGARLIFDCENRTGQQLRLTFGQIALDDTLIDMYSVDRWAESGSMSIELSLSANKLQSAHLPGVRQFSIGLSVDYGEYGLRGPEALYKDRLTIDLPMDFSALYAPEKGVIFGQTEWQGMPVELIDLHLDGEDALCGQLHIVNLTEEQQSLYARYAYINHIRHNVTANDAIMLPGQEIYLDFMIKTRGVRGLLILEGPPVTLEQLGTTEITELAFDMAEKVLGDSTRTVFQLMEAVAYPAGETADWPVVYDRNGVTVSVMGSCTYPDDGSSQNERCINLYVHNDTDHELMLNTVSYPPMDDGVVQLATLSTKKIPAHTVTSIACLYSRSDVEIMPPTFEMLDVTIGLFDFRGRFDLLHLRLEALGEPVETVFPHLLGTTQAWVYAPDQLRVTASIQPPVSSQPALLEAFGDPDSWPVLFDQDGLTLSLMGICVFPKDDLRNTSHIFYLAARNERETFVELVCRLGLENGESAQYFYMVPSLDLSILSQVQPGANTVQEIFLSMGDSPATIEADSLAGAITINDGETSYTLIFAALPTAEPLFLERISEDWPGPCYVYGSDRLDVRMSVAEATSP